MTNTGRDTDATPRTDADITELVLAQHAEIKLRFDDLLNGMAGDRDAAFCELRRLLAVHETAEELIVHPALRRTGDDGDDIVDRRLAEESEAKRALADLEKLGVEDPAFLRHAGALRDAVVAHADHEEAEELPRLRDRLSSDVRQGMAVAFRAAEAAAPTHPHPHGPDGALGNVVVGPAAAIADRVRDAVAKVTS
jgi:hemerythrin superfamily protein